MDRTSIRTDKVLSKIALGFMAPGLIGFELFPRVSVDEASGKIIQFDKSAFQLINTRRAPGENTKRIKVGFDKGNYSLTNNALDAQIPREWLRDQASTPGIDFKRQSVETVMQVEQNNLEFEQANLARDANNYGTNNKVTLSGTSQWSNYDNSDPLKDVSDYKEAVRAQIGSYPNKMVIPAKVHETLKHHPKLLARMSNNDLKMLTLEHYRQLFEIEKIVIGQSMVVDADDAFEDLWGLDVILAYVPTVITSRAMPSYGYTYVLNGQPLVEPMWYDKATKSWIAGVEYERQPLLTGISSGFLIKNAVANS
ncbi:hypothetical protein SAMN05216361_0039 [Marisediminitalea aggregata]|uniref:Phage major capsid protein E n=1 Tax=Marisediminitalea aggregata TaxID=634436 RepID=A0A1M5SN74_9ALTE|nr:hypothetical protein [Marisediminitalea aggregata]SHH39900.1 hypothetical protein SAMN05216361_0039 [Marisediminitalea aggregata]